MGYEKMNLLFLHIIMICHKAFVVQTKWTTIEVKELPNKLGFVKPVLLDLRKSNLKNSVDTMDRQKQGSKVRYSIFPNEFKWTISDKCHASTLNF